MQIHITTHTGEKRKLPPCELVKVIVNLVFIVAYVCPEEGCHRSFSVRSNMRRHVRIVHQVAPSLEGATDSSEDGDGREE